MHASALELIRRRRDSPIWVYLRLLKGVRKVDLSADSGLAFRTLFNGFYGVRRNSAWRVAFYERFQQLKFRRAGAENLFAALLGGLADDTGRTEASFASKAVATLCPESPVIDSIVRKALLQLTLTPPFGRGVEEALAYYAWLTEFVATLADTNEARTWANVFDAAFLDIPGAREIHIHKKLDFLIWGGAPANLPR